MSGGSLRGDDLTVSYGRIVFGACENSLDINPVNFYTAPNYGGTSLVESDYQLDIHIRVIETGKIRR